MLSAGGAARPEHAATRRNGEVGDESAGDEVVELAGATRAARRGDVLTTEAEALQMPDRANVFAVHSWDNAEDCRRMEELLRASDPDLAHYSLPPERAVDGTPEDVAKSIRGRIQFATAVIVLNSPGLHRRPTSSLEMQAAVELGKRIVVVQRAGEFQNAVPAVLDGHVYRYAPWRSDVVGRAIRGEYPYDLRIFDLAEVADRRFLVGVLAAGVVASSVLVAVNAAWSFHALEQELTNAGVQMRWNGDDTGRVLRHVAAGALIGGAIGMLSGDGKTALLAAGAGGAVGAAIAVCRTYNARILGTANLRVLAVEPA